MSNRVFRSAFVVLALFLALPRLAAAQWQVVDTFTLQTVVPGSAVSVLEDVAPPFFAQRVYRVTYTGSGVLWPVHLGTCSALGDPDIVIPYQPSPEVYPEGTDLVVRHITTDIGTHEAQIICPGAFSFTVRGRMLDPDPKLLLETPTGTNVTHLSTFNFGSTQAGTAVDKDFRLINFGNQTLTVSLSLTGSAYSVVTPPPASLAKGTEATFRLRLLTSTAGTATGQLVLNHNDPGNNNPFKVNLTGSVSPLPEPQILITSGKETVTQGTTVDLGGTTPGAPLDRTFTISNPGNATLSLANPATFLSGTGFTLLLPPAASVAAGGSTNFTVRFQAGTIATYTATASLSSNDPHDSPLAFNLRATVTAAPAPQIQITDNGNGGAGVAKGSTINLGSTAPNTPLDRTFTISNPGNATLSLTNPSSFVSGGGFTLWTSPAASVAAGGSTSFTVRLQAGATGTYAGAVSLSSNDPDDNPFTFNLQATVTPAPVPRIRVVDETTGQTIVPGSTTISFGTPAPNAAVIHNLRIYNDGGATLTLGNPGSFVSGGGFTLASFPASSVAALGSTPFSIRFLAGAAGTYSGSAALLHNDTAVASPLGFSLQATVQVPLVPRLRVTTDGGVAIPAGGSFDFGGVNTGSSVQRSFFFSNDGNTPLSLAGASVTGGAFSVVQALPASIPAGGSAGLIVRFGPTAVGPNTGRITWSTNDPSVSTYTLNLSGTGLGAKIRVVSTDSTSIFSGNSYNYPSTPVGTPISRQFTVFNDGNVPLTINYSLDTTEGWVTLEAPPTSLAAGASGTFRIRLQSATAGAKTARVNLANNDVTVPGFYFNLQGSVTAAGPRPDIRIVSGDGITITSGLVYLFPSTTTGTATSRAFTIYNDGDAPLNVAGVTVTGTGFSLIVSPPATIAAGSSGIFRVRLLSATAATYNGSVSVTSDDPDENPVTFSVRGTVT